MSIIWTNNYHLPDTLERAIRYDSHRVATGATMSVTTLYDAAQIRYLKMCYDYEQDVMDGMWAMLGTVMHHMLERANIQSERKRAFMLTIDYLEQIAQQTDKNNPVKAMTLRKGIKWLGEMMAVLFPETQDKYIFEKTMTIERGGHIISGTFDLYDKETGTLWDYKVCSTYQWTHPYNRKKWDRQLNTYAYMIRHVMGLPVNSIRVLALFRNWTAADLPHKDYPRHQIQEMFIPVYSDEEVETMMDYHLELHNRAMKGEVPKCTGEERWATADIWAVLKHDFPKQSKRALKRFDDELSALEFIKINQIKYSAGLYVEKRPGQSRRCEMFCPVNKHCIQYAAYLKERAKTEETP